MAEYNFVESDYRFTAPVRYFTANDPYYWEVDNIPLQQLMENDLWLKDQVGNLAKGEGFTREDFAELKPYVTGNDNKVKVKPGRFTARINDTTSSIKFMTIRRIAGQTFDEYHGWQVATGNTTAIRSNIDKIVSSDADDATFLNGLMERAFTYPAKTPFEPFIDYRNAPVVWNPILPITDTAFWTNRTDIVAGSDSEVLATNYITSQQSAGFAPDTQLQTLFMKFWRGIVRTSIVDVPEELEIEVPAFRIEDFNYEDENGNLQRRESAQVRIDLIFIYSKPIDAKESRIIDKTSGDGIRVITQPTLGLVKGAGAFFSREPYTSVPPHIDGGGQDSDGNSRIVASVADSLTTTNGFLASGIHGSFPSPDDLMNVAPLISEELETNDPLLIGQSILPVAYVVVRRNASINQDGIQVIPKTNLVDIRPFFRTTELTYAERAGIAAAMPPLSISNPVVSKAELRYETIKIVQDYNARFNSIESGGTGAGGGTGTPAFPRVVGAGYLFGGSLFGPESVLHDYYKTSLNDPSKTPAELNSLIIARHGYSINTIIPDYPDWDVARWVSDFNLPEPGNKINDYINVFHRDDEAFDFGHYETNQRLNAIRDLGTEGGKNKVNVYFVKKKIFLDKQNVGWMGDYTVKASLMNCVPLSSRRNATLAGASDIWINKEPDGFTIYCAWTADGSYQTVRGSFTGGLTGGVGRDPGITLTTIKNSPQFNREGMNYSGFLVMTNGMYEYGGSKRGDKYPGEPAVGVSVYPSIMFEIVGIPNNYAGQPGSLAGTTPITLV